jgi:hypothetical protein
MTDADFEAWLISPDSLRCVLVEATCYVDGVETVRYLSNLGYNTQGGDTPPNTAYLPVLGRGGTAFAETLSLDQSGLSYGDIEIINAEGQFDAWLLDRWINCPVKMFVGDPRWARADFRMVFNGIAADLSSKSRTRLNILIRDKMERLNSPVTDVKLGGTTQNKDELLPLVFGEVHNMTPLLIDPSLHTYQVHQGQIHRVIEVRDNGVPVTIVADTVSGTFNLTGTPAGAITASVQGDTQPDWNITVASIIKRLVTGYGKEPMRLTEDDIDLDNFAAFDTAHPQPVGICTTSKTNVVDMVQALAKSLGAQPWFNRLGKLQLLQLSFPGVLPASGIAQRFGPEDMAAQNLSIAQRSPVQAAVILAYCRNWTVQTGLQTGILEEHKARFATEWDTFTAKYTVIAQQYGLDLDPDQRETMLLRRKEAEPEAWRLLDMLCVPRTTYRFQAYGRGLLLSLGEAVLLEHPRFNLDAIVGGTPGVVVGLTPDWFAGRCLVDVMV